jgi:cell volume regulation protein A
MAGIELLLILSAVLLVLAVLASKFSVRTGVPALLLFLLIGMLMGSDGPGRIYFDYPWLTQAIGVVALAYILFSGGLDTQWADVRAVWRSGLSLSTIGVLMTALLVGGFVHLVLDFPLAEGILLGSIIASTDAAAVFSVLRGQSVRLRGFLRPVLEVESGSNDPLAVFLTIGMLQLVQHPEQSPLTLLPLFIQQMGLGVLFGWGLGLIGRWLLNRLDLEYDGLYPVLTVALVLLVYGLTTALGGNGFLAVYLAGLLIGQKPFIHRRSLLQFHDGLAWLMQIAMFITLGLQVYPSRLPAVALDGLLVAGFVILIARPISVFIALIGARCGLRERLFIAAVGLRGAAPIVLATFPLLAGIDRAGTIFNLVFFIVLTSVLLQGTLIVPLARLLGVEDRSPPARSPLDFVMDDREISNNLAELTLPEGSPWVGQRIFDLMLPDDVLIVLIGRGQHMIVPRGTTAFEAGDRVLVLASDSALRALRAEIAPASPRDSLPSPA